MLWAVNTRGGSSSSLAALSVRDAIASMNPGWLKNTRSFSGTGADGLVVRGHLGQARRRHASTARHVLQEGQHVVRPFRAAEGNDQQCVVHHYNAAAMPTVGPGKLRPVAAPSNSASPKLKMPPSRATSQ